MRNGKEGHEFNVRVVLGRVGDDVVDIMAALPPAKAQPTNKVGNEDADNGVGFKIVRDTHMAGIMGREDYLVPEEAEKDSGKLVPACTKEIQEG